jgi:hypothetical protein
LAPNAFKLSLVFPDPALHPNALTSDPELLRAALNPKAFTDEPVLLRPALGPIKFTIDPELLKPVRLPNKFTLVGVPFWLLDIPTINRKGLLCMVTETLLMALSPVRLDKVTVPIVAVGAVKFPPTEILLFVVTASDSVVVPNTKNDAADRLAVDVADSVVNPDTFRLFRIVVAETVRSPLIVAVVDTWRHAIVTVAFPAEIDVPPTVRLF